MIANVKQINELNNALVGINDNERLQRAVLKYGKPITFFEGPHDECSLILAPCTNSPQYWMRVKTKLNDDRDSVPKTYNLYNALGRMYMFPDDTGSNIRNSRGFYDGMQLLGRGAFSPPSVPLAEEILNEWKRPYEQLTGAYARHSLHQAVKKISKAQEVSALNSIEKVVQHAIKGG